MVMKVNLAYFGKEAVYSFRRNWVQSVAAITTVALCLVVVGIIAITLYVGGLMIKEIESQVEIQVYLADTAETKPIQAFQEKLVSWDEVKEVKYVSKQEALEIFKKKFENNPEVVENLSDNPLPASFVIMLNNSREVEDIAGRIKSIDNIDELVTDEKDIKYGKEFVGRLFAFTRRLSMATSAFAILLIFVSLVLITNTIRLAIFGRRKEIGIMRLVGASSWFIRIPFIIEGMIEGAIGSGVAILILTLLYRTFFSKLANGEWLSFVSIPFDQGAFISLIFMLGFGGIAIGALGSMIALRRFLKV